MSFADDRIFVDITEFVNHPVRTGVQRVLVGIIRNLPVDRLVLFRVDSRSEVAIVDPAIVQFMARYFDSVMPTARSRLARIQNGRDTNESVEGLRVRRAGLHPVAIVPASEMFARARAVVNLEIIADRERSALYLGCSPSDRHKVFHWIHDFLPFERPDVFELDWRRGADHINMFRAYAVAGGFLCAHPVLVTKIARYFGRRPEAVHVIGAGCDLGGGVAPPESPPKTTRIVALGTLEPRKYCRVTASAMETIAREAEGAVECLMIGRWGWLQPAEAEALRTIFARGLVRHSDRLADDDLASVMAGTSVAVYVSEAEGFGLPVVEFAARGIPVVVNGAVPAAMVIPENLRVDPGEVSELTLAAAIRTAMRKGVRQGPRYAKTWAECAADVLRVVDANGTAAPKSANHGFYIVPRIAAMVGRETRSPREIRAGVAQEIVALTGAPATGLVDEITDLLVAARGRLFWTEIEAVRELFAAFLRGPLADNHIECLRRAHVTFLDRSVDARSVARASTYVPLSRALAELRQIALGAEAERTLGPETIANLKLVLQSLGPLLSAVSEEPLDIFAVFTELGIGEPSLDDALEARALAAEGIHPFELLVYFGHRRPPAGDEIALLLEILAEIIERRGARIRATYSAAELAEGGSDLAFLRRAYRLVLRTEIDDEGLAYYLDALRCGELTRTSVVFNLASADAARRRGIDVI